MHQYPLPLPDELLAKLNGGKQFGKFDSKKAHAKIPLAEKPSRLIVINTHKRLLLSFGVASCPALFQQFIGNVLQGCKDTAVFLGDIIVTGGNFDEHAKISDQVLGRLEANGLRIRRDKFSFMGESIEYTGFLIVKGGRHMSGDKTKAIFEMPHPQDNSHSRLFLSMVNH